MAFPRISGTGQLLNLTGALGGQLPQPNQAFPASFTQGVQPTNLVSLPAGAALIVPAGEFLCTPGGYTSLQFGDPVAGKWTTVNADNSYQMFHLDSDGSNIRLANLTGCPIGALVTNAGSGYTNGVGTAVTGLTITPSAGGSVWVPVVGGAINSTVVITAGGTNYTFPPMLIIGAPPLGGVQATAVCTVSGGAINSVTVINQGAGYTTAPIINIVNDPRDTTGSGAILTVNATLVGSGALTAMYPASSLPTTVGAAPTAGYGTPLTALPTFTFSPASTTAATAVMQWTATSLTVTGGGVAVPAGSTGVAGPTLTAGAAAANTAGPISNVGLSFPRAAWFFLNISAGVVQASGNTVVDGGLFQAVPSFGLINSTGVAPTTGVNISVNVGGVNDVSWLQPF